MLPEMGENESSMRAVILSSVEAHPLFIRSFHAETKDWQILFAGTGALSGRQRIRLDSE
jgi:hypothetical protein